MLNTEATIGLARAAQRAGAKRFVFLSSIRAQAGATADHILTEDLAPLPTDAYGRSKLAAEQGLAALDLDWVALRLVLVYGTGVKGNMAELVRFARSPYPLPLGLLRAKRSLLSLDNLVTAIDAVLTTPERLRRPLIVADPKALTIPEMIAALRGGLGRRPGLIPIPLSVLETALRVTGRSEIYQRLAGSLVADPSALSRLGWSPTVTTPEGLAALARI
jgi:UDP-glucose 4-epimerase